MKKIHWADDIANKVLEKGKKKPIIATGITPSGDIHIGNMREVVTADTVYRALLDKGADAKLIYIADTYDPLRKVYPFLRKKEEYSENVGKPLSEIPCPCGKCANYAEHFLNPFLDSLNKLGIYPEIYRADELYKKGMYNEVIKNALINRDRIAKILEQVSKRELSDNWNPFNPVCKNCGRINKASVTGFDLKKEIVEYKCECGYTGENAIHEGKLTWRVDWSARWSVLGVTVEPFGKDHAAAGGSWDTGKRISLEIYDYDPPYPIVYEWITLEGTPMSSSKGVTISIKEMLEILPPEILRYLIIRTKPEKHIDFNPGLPLLNLVDEYDSAVETRSFELSQTSESKYINIPFRHFVTAVQIANNNFEQLLAVLKRSGYPTSEQKAIKQRAINAKNWLDKYAPSFVQFKIQDSIPVQVKNLSKKQKNALKIFAERIYNKNAEELHAEVYTLAQELELTANKIFQAIYIAILGQKSGPRAGYFLASLDPEFVAKRFMEVALSR